MLNPISMACHMYASQNKRKQKKKENRKEENNPGEMRGERKAWWCLNWKGFQNLEMDYWGKWTQNKQVWS